MPSSTLNRAEYLFSSYNVEVLHFSQFTHNGTLDVRYINRSEAQTLYTWYKEQVLWLTCDELSRMPFMKMLKKRINTKVLPR